MAPKNYNQHFSHYFIFIYRVSLTFNQTQLLIITYSVISHSIPNIKSHCWLNIKIATVVTKTPTSVYVRYPDPITMVYGRYIYSYMRVSQTRGTPSSHPFLFGIFHSKPSSYWGSSICGNYQINKETQDALGPRSESSSTLMSRNP